MIKIIAKHTAMRILAEIKHREANGEFYSSPILKNRVEVGRSIKSVNLNTPVTLVPEFVNPYLQQHDWRVSLGENEEGKNYYIATRR